MSHRQFIVALLGIASLLTAGASTACAQQEGKKKKKAAAESSAAVGTIVGTINRVSDDGRTFTVTPFGGTKKQPATTTEFKVTDRTSVEFIGFPTKEDLKLAAGYAVIVAFDGKDKETATLIKVAKTDAPAKKKKKTGQ
jgi:hypothetical protein